MIPYCCNASPDTYYMAHDNYIKIININFMLVLVFYNITMR